MAKNLVEQVEDTLAVFSKDITEALFPKVCADMASFLGRQNISTKDGEWKAGAKLSLTAKDQHKMQLPMNAPQSYLLWFAIRLNEVADLGGMEIQSTVPEQCKAWIERSKLVGKINNPEPEAVK